MHSLRRVFGGVLENGLLLRSEAQDIGGSSEPMEVYANWIRAQLTSFLDLLHGLVIVDDVEVKAAAIRTTMEFVMREHMYRPQCVFGVTNYGHLLHAMLLSPEIDIDVLLAFRDEVLDKADCIFYGEWVKRFLSIAVSVFITQSFPA